MLTSSLALRRRLTKSCFKLGGAQPYSPIVFCSVISGREWLSRFDKKRAPRASYIPFNNSSATPQNLLLVTATTRGFGMDAVFSCERPKALQDIEDAHQAACDAGISRYSDPSTGYMVFTQNAHEKRGFCCGSMCRHCPFGHVDVMREYRPAGSAPKTAMLGQFRKRRKVKLTVGAAWKSFKDDTPRDVLFWSGGKKSLLTLRALQQEQRTNGEMRNITLLTTYDSGSGKVPFQCATVADVMAQAKREELDILTVPVPGNGSCTPNAGAPQEEQQQQFAAAILAALEPIHVKSLAFGDVRSQQSLRKIREYTLSQRGNKYPCRFPIFDVRDEELFARLWAEEGIITKVSHVDPEYTSDALKGVAVGDVLDKSLLAQYAGLGGRDIVSGEGLGRFHTHVHYNDEGGGKLVRRRVPRESTSPSSAGSTTSSATDETSSSSSSDDESSDASSSTSETDRIPE